VAAGLDQQSIRAALDPRRFIAERTLRGGPAPQESLRQARLFEDGVLSDEKVVAGIDARLDEAARNLETAIDTVIAMAP